MSGTPLVLLTSAESWEEFQGDISTHHCVDGKGVSWTDSAPASYPCLVSAVRVQSSIVCLFVYPKDVAGLLSKDIDRTGDLDHDTLIGLTKEELLALTREGKADDEASPRRIPVKSPQLPEFSTDAVWSRHMVALCLAIVHEMLSVGLTSEDRFEEVLAAMVVSVEDKHVSDVEEVKKLIRSQFKPKGDGKSE